VHRSGMLDALIALSTGSGGTLPLVLGADGVVEGDTGDGSAELDLSHGQGRAGVIPLPVTA
jgi:hypothetical protein